MKTESEIIQDYISDSEKSIVVCDDFFFMLVRITGLGIAYRLDKDKLLKKLEDYSFALSAATNALGIVSIKTALQKIVETHGRDVAEQLYLQCMNRVDRDTDSFSDLSLYNGLPILKRHPENDEMLSFYNIAENPIIGTIVRAYKRENDNEIWGVAKIYDLSLLKELELLSSTSPAVVSQWTFEKNDGIITARESPIYLNHLAFVERGFWDKTVDNPNGYIADSCKINKETKMANEKKEPTPTAPAAIADSSDSTCSENVKTADSAAQVTPATTADSSDKEPAPTIPAPPKDDGAPANAKIADDDIVHAEIRKQIEEELRKELETQIRAELEAEFRKKAEAEAKEKELENERKALLDSAQETALDKERWALISRFRDVVSTAPDSVGAKMPYLGNDRLNPSATISRILSVNEGLYNPKYQKAIDSAYSEGTYALQKDAFEDLIKTIQAKSVDAYKTANVKTDGFRPTANPNVFVNPNF